MHNANGRIHKQTKRASGAFYTFTRKLKTHVYVRFLCDKFITGQGQREM